MQCNRMMGIAGHVVDSPRPYRARNMLPKLPQGSGFARRGERNLHLGLSSTRPSGTETRPQSEILKRRIWRGNKITFMRSLWV